MYKIVKQSEGTIRKIADNKTALNLVTKDVTEAISLTVVEAENYRQTETTDYNRIYFVLDGSLGLDFEGRLQHLHKGDACFISKDTTYEMQGTFKAVVVNQPAFGI